VGAGGAEAVLVGNGSQFGSGSVLGLPSSPASSTGHWPPELVGMLSLEEGDHSVSQADIR
jgi:hypothetical protein